MFVSNKQRKTMSAIIIIASKCFECVYMLQNLRIEFSKEKKIITCVKLPKGEFTSLRVNRKSNMKTKLGLFTNVSTTFTSLIKQRSHAINSVF